MDWRSGHFAAPYRLKVTEPYRKMPGLNDIDVVTLTDPWGVSIEPSEGLDNVQ